MRSVSVYGHSWNAKFTLINGNRRCGALSNCIVNETKGRLEALLLPSSWPGTVVRHCVSTVLSPPAALSSLPPVLRQLPCPVLAAPSLLFILLTSTTTNTRQGIAIICPYIFGDYIYRIGSVTEWSQVGVGPCMGHVSREYGRDILYILYESLPHLAGD